MNYLSNQMYIMSGKDDLTQFWADSYGLSAKHYKTVYASNIIREHGISFLHKKIENDVVKYKISLLLIDISVTQCNPFIIFDLKQKYGLMVVLLAIDDEMKFDWISSSYGSIADLVITTDYVSVDRYRQSGVNAYFLPLPVHIQEKTTPSKFIYDVSFVGRVDKGKPIREKYINFLKNEMSVSIFGSSGPSDPQFLSVDKMYSIFRNSTVNLNFTGITTYVPSENPLFERIRGMKLRPFEIAAAGGMCISEFSISLAKSFKDGVEIVFFTNEYDMVEKIKYYLEHQDEARKIAISGQDKVMKKYSNEAIAMQFKSLTKKSQACLGVDLYGTPQRVKISRWFAYSLIEYTSVNIVTLLVKGRFRLFFCDIGYLIRFIKRLSINIGTIFTFQAIFIGLYRLIKTILFKVKF